MALILEVSCEHKPFQQSLGPQSQSPSAFQTLILPVSLTQPQGPNGEKFPVDSFITHNDL